jgi:hypothetical protein
MSGAIAKAGSATLDYGIDVAVGASNITQSLGKGESVVGDITGLHANLRVSLFQSKAFAGRTAAKAAAKVAAKSAQVATSVATSAGTGAAGTAGSTIAAGSAGGPVGFAIAVAIVILQVVGGIIDAAWNPYKNYYNKDLDDLKSLFDKQLKKTFLSLGLNYPLEVKPYIFPITESEVDQFKDYIKYYYDSNGLISKEEVLLEEQLFLELQKIKRETKKFYQDENGNVVVRNPVYISLDAIEQNERNTLILLALGVAQKRKQIENLKIKNDPTIKYKNFAKENWQLFISVIIVIIFSIILILRNLG